MDEGRFSIPGVIGIATAGLVIVLLVICCLRLKDRHNRSTRSAQPPQPVMHPVIIREQNYRPPPSPRYPTRYPGHVPSPTSITQFQTPISDTSDVRSNHSLGPHPQMVYPSTIQGFHPPATPPTTYHPHPTIHYHLIRPHPPPPPQDQLQQNRQFDSDDILSFEATGNDKKSPCPICLDPLEEEPISTGQCLHLMHTSCLKGWLAKDAKSACPVCRLPYSDELTTDRPIPTAPPFDREDTSSATT